ALGPYYGAAAGMAEDSAAGPRLLGHGPVLRTETGLRHRFRQPGAGRKDGSQRPHPTATGGAGPELDGIRGSPAVLRTPGDAEGEGHGAAADHLDQRRNAGATSNRDEYCCGVTIPSGWLTHPGSELEGHLPDRLHHQPSAGKARRESARLLSGPLGNRESGVSHAVTDLGHRPSG